MLPVSFFEVHQLVPQHQLLTGGQHNQRRPHQREDTGRDMLSQIHSKPVESVIGQQIHKEGSCDPSRQHSDIYNKTTVQENNVCIICQWVWISLLVRDRTKAWDSSKNLTRSDDFLNWFSIKIIKKWMSKALLLPPESVLLVVWSHLSEKNIPHTPDSSQRRQEEEEVKAILQGRGNQFAVVKRDIEMIVIGIYWWTYKFQIECENVNLGAIPVFEYHPDADEPCCVYPGLGNRTGGEAEQG